MKQAGGAEEENLVMGQGHLVCWWERAKQRRQERGRFGGRW